MNQPTPPDDSPSPTETAESDSTQPEQETAPLGGALEEAAGDTGEEQTATDAAPQTPAPRGGRALAVLAFLIAIVAGAGSAYVFWITQLASDRADSVRADVSGDMAQLANRMTELDQQLRALQAEKLSLNSQFTDLRTADGKMGKRLEALESSIVRLAKRESDPAPGDWRLAEVENLLRIAIQQATLAHNPTPALAALSEADSILRRMSDPRLQRVRSQVADDILALQSVARPDVEGIALRLGSLARRVDALPLAGQQGTESEGPATDDETGGLARLKAKIADFFSSIFRVRRTEGADAPLLSPQESFFLRRNLELELQAARIAVLLGDSSAYRTSIISARRWTEQYFRTEEPGVRAFITALGELESRQTAVEIPDISGSLEALLATETDQVP